MVTTTMPSKESALDRARVGLWIQSDLYRHSLMALLRTLPELEIICMETKGAAQPHDKTDYDLIILDDSLNPDDITAMQSIWPGARYLALVNWNWHGTSHLFPRLDMIIPKSASAGEFLSVVRQFSRANAPGRVNTIARITTLKN